MRICGALFLLFLCLTAAGALPAEGATSRSSSYSGYQNQLFGVAAVSPGDVWAVGLHCPSTCGGEPAGPQPLIQHWDGTSWSKVTVPGLGPTGALYAVSAVSASDIWAVGAYAGQSLIVHWNGSAWSPVSSPVAGTLYAVSARSATNVWAVGDEGSGTGTTDTVIMHWDGSSWSQVSSPSPGGLDQVSSLKAVSVVSADSAWAVGYYTSPQVPSGQMLIMHWDGTEWSQVAAPNLGPTESQLSGISATSGGAWAVGQYCAASPVIGCGATQQNTLVLHLTGSTWTQVSSPNPSSGNYLYGATAPAAADSWAVGYDGSGAGAYDPLILHWTGGNWTQVPSPAPSTVFNFLYQVSAYSAHNAWVVGYYCVQYCENEEIDHSLILHWNGSQWSRK